jgi:hypothetical protein
MADKEKAKPMRFETANSFIPSCIQNDNKAASQK